MTHAAHCDYGVTYGGGRRGQCTCGAVAEQLTADQVVRVIALRLGIETAMSPTEAIANAQLFETYIRGDL